MTESCPTCGREEYIKPLDEKGKYRCGFCGEILTESKPKSKPKSTAKNKMETPNDPAGKE